MTSTSKQTPAQARRSALSSDFATLYAVAGLADTLAAQTKTTLLQTRKYLANLPEHVKSLPETTRTKLAEAQHSAQGLAAEASSGYGNLAGRGKRVFDDARVLVAEVAERMDPAFERVQETVTIARRRVTGHTTTDTVTSRSAAEAAARRAAKRAEAETVARETAARKVAVKKATARAAAKQTRTQST